MSAPVAPSTNSAANHGLQRQLHLRDLVLTQVMTVVGSSWVGVAAGLGRAQALVWVFAMLVFYVPMAASVYCLNRELPLEGGLYVWARRAFGDAGGFLTAWNLWAYGLCVTATITVAMPTELTYLVGPSLGWLPRNPLASILLVWAVVLALMLTSLYGLAVGKWLYDASGVALLLVFGVLILLPLWGLAHHLPLHLAPLEVRLPPMNARSFAFIGQMFGALCGLEYLAILAGETEAPGRMIGRSVLIASPIICAMFILGTGSVLAFHELHPERAIDFIAPIPQTLRFALGQNTVTRILAAGAIGLLQVRLLGASSFIFTGVTRLPMTAGWDHLLPQRFSRLHPRYRTPAFSIYVAAALVALLLLLASIGVRAAEAFQVLTNAAVEFYALAYLAMFAIPLAGVYALRSRLPRWMQWSSATGFAFTLYCFVVTAYPIVHVVNTRLYAAKTLGTVALVNLGGVLLYRRRKGLAVQAHAACATAGSAPPAQASQQVSSKSVGSQGESVG